jgi:hypothetical protein
VIVMHNHPSGVIPHPVLCRMASRFAHFALGEPFPRAA